ncbi:hypothetical protein VPH35_109597 [Triticum aestivum]
MQGLQFDGGLPLWTHGHANHAARNEAAISILKQCTAANRLSLHLHVPSYMRDALVDGTGSGMADFWQGSQCSNLEDLRIDVTRGTEKPACLDRACVCHDEDGWENQQLSLERLVHLDIVGFQGLDYEERLAQMILAGAPALKRE